MQKKLLPKIAVVLFLIVFFGIFLSVMTIDLNPEAIVIFIVFVMIEILFVVALISIIIKHFKEKRVAKIGKEYMATFVSFDSNVTVNGVPKYRMHYTWQDEYGNVKTDKTGSDYVIQEVQIFETVKNFKIKSDGEVSIIMDDPAKILHKLKKTHGQKTNTVKCSYCGTVFDDTNDRCSSCGAPKNK